MLASRQIVVPSVRSVQARRTVTCAAKPAAKKATGVTGDAAGLYGADRPLFLGPFTQVPPYLTGERRRRRLRLGYRRLLLRPGAPDPLPRG